jgi:hypothetical protein
MDQKLRPPNTDNKGKLFSLLRQLADPADAVVTFFARRRVQKMRHTLITHRSFSGGGPCTVTLFRPSRVLGTGYHDPDRCSRRVTGHRGRPAPSLKQPAGLFLNARPSLLPGR